MEGGEQPDQGVDVTGARGSEERADDDVVLGPRDGPYRRRGAIIVGVAVALVVVNFAYIYPVLTDQLMLYKDWLARMWLRSWI